MKGKIIVISGTDGCGKQTQTEKLFEYLKSKNLEVKKQSFPNYDSPSSGPLKMYMSGELGKNANMISPYQASALYAVDRFCTMKKYQTYLKKGGILLLDRYMESNLIHQACKISDSGKKQEFIDWINNFEFNELKIPVPNIIIFLDMPPKMSIEFANRRGDLKSGAKKDIHEQDPSHLINAYNNGIEIAKNNNWSIINCLDEKNNLKTIEQIHIEVVNIVENLLKITKD